MIEDLGIKNIVKNTKLAKAMLDVGWGQFLTVLNYKAKWNGQNILDIGRFVPSSKVYFHCGYAYDQMLLHILYGRAKIAIVYMIINQFCMS
ncbi:transposase [Acinetobacter sp. B5B]|uniref:transposase n=1 Tax=Acinetobacter baretiae TaxID=2605383 RepID=UPI0018C204E3|nr:transposase [Acinetobacter baretiae]MBF7683620.1 transposase [Acinetobacter baretiae]MBF7686059.1 transposase [Acinetobacter baretiae]